MVIKYFVIRPGGLPTYSVSDVSLHTVEDEVQVVLDAELHLWRAFLDSETVTVGAMKCYHLV